MLIIWVFVEGQSSLYHVITMHVYVTVATGQYLDVACYWVCIAGRNTDRNNKGSIYPVRDFRDLGSPWGGVRQSQVGYDMVDRDEGQSKKRLCNWGRGISGILSPCIFLSKL